MQQEAWTFLTCGLTVRPLPLATTKRGIMQRNKRVSQSCKACRDKKRRCDRKRPCSNCAVRDIDCLSIEDAHQVGTSGGLRTRFQVHTRPPQERTGVLSTPIRKAAIDEGHDADLQERLKKLEDAVFAQNTERPSEQIGYVPFASHSLPDPGENSDASEMLRSAKSNLPPINEARLLMEHIATALHAYWGIFHIPTCQETLERIYRDDESPASPVDLLVILSCFAAAAFTCTTALLQNLRATHQEAQAALMVYLREAVAILENKQHPVGLSVSAWAATASLFALTTHLRGMSDATLSLKMKCLSMAQQLQVHRLDTKERRDERRLKGCNHIEIELQRRVWWHLMANDW